MYQPDNTLAQGRTQMLEPLFRRRQVQLFALLHQRAHPVTLSTLRDCIAHMGHDFVYPVCWHYGRLDRLSPGRLFIKDRHVHIAILGQRQAARDRRCGHDQHVNGLTLASQLQPLAHTKPVLFVDHGQSKILKFHVFLEYGVRANQHVNISARQGSQLGRTFLALVAACQDLHHHSGGFRQRL